jgi:glycosyltransferase involved in cell wall biosynthesis
MRIVFFNAKKVPINGNSLNEKTLGASEMALIEIARGLAKLDWDVSVYTNCDREGNYEGVEYKDYRRIMEIEGLQNDVFVSMRDVMPFVSTRPPATKTILWTHDVARAYKNLDIFHDAIDEIFATSNYQMNDIANAYKIPKEKFWVCDLGIDKKFFDEHSKNVSRDPDKVIYCTTPYRGLDVLLDAWPEIRKRSPNAWLRVISGMSLYSMPSRVEFNELIDKARAMEKQGVKYSEPLPRADFVRELAEASVFAYPNHFPETYCTVASEATYLDVGIVSSAYGAIPEVVGDNAVLIEGDSKQPAYREKFIDAVVAMLKNGHKPAGRKPRDWNDVARDWDARLRK